MGRTNPTYRDFLDGYERRFTDYRRALRYRDQEAFDRLFQRARRYADAAGYANDRDRDQLVLFSVLLAQERELAEREERIADLEATVDRLCRIVEG